MANSTADKAPSFPFDRVLTAISDKTRLRVLEELFAGDALPVGELAKRIRVPVTNVSKHLKVLVETGTVQKVFGRLYRLAPGLANTEERAIEFGPITLRIDRIKLK